MRNGTFDFHEKDPVKGFAPMMREAIRTDRMPPWDPDPHVGKFKDEFVARGAADEERDHHDDGAEPERDAPADAVLDLVRQGQDRDEDHPRQRQIERTEVEPDGAGFFC